MLCTLMDEVWAFARPGALGAWLALRRPLGLGAVMFSNKMRQAMAPIKQIRIPIRRPMMGIAWVIVLAFQKKIRAVIALMQVASILLLF